MSSGTSDGNVPTQTAAEIQFNTSSKFTSDVPAGYTAWQIRNDYPPPMPANAAPPTAAEAPWLTKDPVDDSKTYMNTILEYCLNGMTEVDFVPQQNTTTQWYHAPWMHYSNSGREPLHGMTAERFSPPGETSATQKRTTQTWAIGFYNSIGASVFGGMWADPNDPDWTEDKNFPLGTLVFKLLWTNATNDEIYFLEGAPTWEGLIAVQPTDPSTPPQPVNRDNVNPQSVRLLQMDIAARDDRAATGWIFGTFMYTNTLGKTGWDGLWPVGLMWGNDSELTQAAFDAGQKVKQTYITKEANTLLASLKGSRPSFGWNGRLNGPADNFISACASCHSTAEWPPAAGGMMPPKPKKNTKGQYVPADDAITMQWFQDIPCGTPFTSTSVSADYSLQLLIGYQNYTNWLQTQPQAPGDGERHAPLPPSQQLPDNPRQGPTLED